jgi:hypothetical protein
LEPGYARQPGYGGGCAGGCDFSNRRVLRIRHIDTAGSINGNAGGAVEKGGGIGETGDAVGAGERGDGGAIERTQGVIVGVGYGEERGRCKGDSGRAIKAGINESSSVGTALGPGESGQGSHDSGRCDLAKGVIAGIGDKKCTRGVDTEIGGAAKTRVGAGGVDCAVGVGRSSQGRYESSRGDLPEC